MLYVLISVFCSVLVSVILKLAKNKGYQHLHLIFWNYLIAVGLAYLFIPPAAVQLPISQLPWGLYLPLAILLPIIFLCIGYSITFSGIVKTEIAQRLSLFIPLLAAYFIFGEDMAAVKLIGIGIGLFAILFSISWHKGNGASSSNWLYAVMVFFGMGVIDILFKKVALYQAVPYSFSMFFVFALAGAFTLLLILFRAIVKKEGLPLKSFGWGLLLGLFNFGNILFYMKAHRALPESPSLVFTGMNIGVILLGTLIGVSFFAERLTAFNKVGLFLAVISVLIIAYL